MYLLRNFPEFKLVSLYWYLFFNHEVESPEFVYKTLKEV